MASDPDIEKFDGCIENLAGAMRAVSLDYVTMSLESTGDVIVTLRCWPPVA